MHQKGSLIIPILIAVLLMGLLGGLAYFNFDKILNLGYEEKVTNTTRPVGGSTSPQEEVYGGVRAVNVREFRQPKFPLNFPDGGVPYYLSNKIVISQIDSDKKVQSKVGEIKLKRVEGKDYSDVLDFSINWSSESKFEYKLVYGFIGGQQITETSQFELQPL